MPDRHNFPTLIAVGFALSAAAIIYWTVDLKRPPAAPSPLMRSAAPANKLTLTIDRDPPNVAVTVDGNPVPGASIELTPGAHELVGVAPGYYGEVSHFALSGTASESVKIALDAKVLPPLEEIERFLKLADAPLLSEMQLSSITERTLHAALEATLLRQSGRSAEAERLARDVDVLIGSGDQRASVVRFLINGIQAGHFSRSQLSPPLLAASDAGDAMATLFVAVAYRGSISDAAVSPADPQFQNYCRFLRSSARQGWPGVATVFWRRDHCTE